YVRLSERRDRKRGGKLFCSLGYAEGGIGPGPHEDRFGKTAFLRDACQQIGAGQHLDLGVLLLLSDSVLGETAQGGCLGGQNRIDTIVVQQNIQLALVRIQPEKDKGGHG